MSDVKKFLINISIFMIIILFIFFFLCLFITQISNKNFQTKYQYTINRKYKKLLETKGPKIIILGGSSGSFGINAKLIEEKLEMPVVNLALHAGFGLKFTTEVSKANIEKGDIVVLAYEYELYSDDFQDGFDAELVVSGIDNNLEMYKYIPFDLIPKVIKYFPTYTIKKLDSINKSDTSGEEYGAYSLYSFDDDGNMAYDRKECILPNDIPKNYNSVNLKDNYFNKEVLDYLNSFSDFVKEKGAHIVLTFPPVIDERFYASESDIEKYENQIDKNLNATRISSINNYVFEREFMYDTIYHLNSRGEEIRSERLADDIYNYIQENA